MLIYRITSAIYLILSILCIFWLKEYKWLVFLSLSFIYISLLAFGTFFIQLNFYIKAFNKKVTNNKVVAITFDDGPVAATTEIVKLLDKYNAKASFFCIGKNILKYPELVKKLHQENHTLGNHSYYHKNNFPIQSGKAIHSEIEETNKVFYKLIGLEPRYFRPPIGVTNPILAKAVLKTKMKVVGWSIRSLDTLNQPKEKILKRIVSQISPGKIILLHDNSDNVLWILEELLQYLQENNYKAVSLKNLENQY